MMIKKCGIYSEDVNKFRDRVSIQKSPRLGSNRISFL